MKYPSPIAGCSHPKLQELPHLVFSTKYLLFGCRDCFNYWKYIDGYYIRVEDREESPLEDLANLVKDVADDQNNPL